MVIQNLKDICGITVKELILRYQIEEDFNKWSEDQIKAIINFVKPKKTLEAEVLEALLKGLYLVEEQGKYCLGPRVVNMAGKWVVK